MVESTTAEKVTVNTDLEVEELVTHVAEKALTTEGIGVLTNNVTYEQLLKGVEEFKDGAVTNLVKYINLASTDKEYLDAFDKKLNTYKCIIVDQRNNHFFEYELLKLLKRAKLRGVEVYKLLGNGLVQL